MSGSLAQEAGCTIPRLTRRTLTRGALAGLAATLPMTLLMFAWHKRLPVAQRYPLPPSLITQRAIYGYARPGQTLAMPRPAATLSAHFAFGAVAGMLYAIGPVALRQEYPAALGAGYGLAVWSGSYFGWVPALRLMPHAGRQPVARNAMMIAAHVAWGLALATVLAGLEGRGGPVTRSRSAIAS